MSEKDQQAEFQKGNINFDLLQPETQSLEAASTVSDEDRPEEVVSKRGLFFRNRHPVPLRFNQVMSWVLLFLASSMTIAWTLFFGRSFVWLLLFPVLFLTMLGSMIMLALLLARPR